MLSTKLRYVLFFVIFVRFCRQFQLIRRRRRRLHLTPFLVSPTDFCRTHKPLGIGSITLERIQCCKYTNYATSLAAASSLRVFRFFLCVYSSARRSSKRFSQISSLHERNRGKWWRTLVKSVHCMRCRSVSGNVYSVYTHTVNKRVGYFVKVYYFNKFNANYRNRFVE